MTEAPIPANERERLAELSRYEVLDTEAEQAIDDLTLLAARLCGAPIALVSLVDANRQWFKAKVGLEATETPRAVAFCAHAILGDDVMVVPDALADDRFADNPLVTGEPRIRFYAGAPLVTSAGYPLGTLCVVDTKARAFDREQQEALQLLSRQVVQRLEQRRQLQELRQAQQAVEAGQQQLQTFLDTTGELIQRVGLDGRILYTNEAWRRTLGYTAEDTARLSLFEVLHPDSRDHCCALFPRLMAGESLPKLELSLLAKDGQRVDVIGSAMCERDAADMSLAVHCIFHDVTERKVAEAQLSASKKWLRTILETEPECVTVMTEDCVLMDINPTGLGFVEADGLDQVQGKSVLPIVGEADRECFSDFHRRVFRGDTGTLQFEIVGLKGTRRWMETKAVPLKNDAGATTGVLAITRDRTQQKAAEEALRESHRRFRAIFDQTLQFIGLLSTTGIVLEANRTALEFAGVQDQDVIGRYFWETPWWTHSPELQRRLQDAVHTAAGGTMVRFEATHPSKTGELAHVDFSLKPVFDDNETVVLLIPEGRDITQRKQAEESLQAMHVELEHAYQYLNFHLQNTPLGVIQWAPDFQLILWSAQAERIFGWTAQEVEGKYPHEWPFIPTDERPAIQESMERLTSGRERRKVHRVRHCGRDGRDLHCVWHTSVMSNESGRVISIMALIQDLSEQVRLEQQFHQAQKMEAVGRLAGGVAHDFNNLLTVINGYSHMVLSNPLTPVDIKSGIEEILHAGHRGTGLIRQLLAFTRQQVVKPQTFSLNETVTNAERMLRHLIGEDVLLHVRLAARWDMIKADPGQIEQVVMNLVLNARDAMPNGGHLSIETETLSLKKPVRTPVVGSLVPGCYVSLVVRDSGTGMDEETLRKIFEPFFTTKGAGKGTGLGLATVHGIVEQCGGAMTVSSHKGYGSTFSIYFPCAEAIDSGTNKGFPQPVIARGTETILLVEDEPAVRSFMREILSADGYTVLEATTAEEAMLLCDRETPSIHLLLTDVVLPQMRGTELAETFSTTRPGIKVLLMSGHVAKSWGDNVSLTQEMLFLQKPFTKDSLLAKIREVLEVKDSSAAHS